MRIEPFEYLRPKTVAEACELLSERGPEAKLIAGGSDLLVQMKQGLVSPKWVVDLKALRALDYIRVDDGELSIGAATTLRSIERSAEVRRRAPALGQAAEKVASIQIRNWATISGNICLDTMCWYYNQSRAWKMSRPSCSKAGGRICYVVDKENVCYATYRGDTAPALIALGARVRIAGRDSQREMLLEELFSGDGVAPLRIGSTEMITEVRIPRRAQGPSSAYLKSSHRNAVDYPQAGVSVFLRFGDGSRRCQDACLALGAVGSGPVRARGAEEMLKGSELTADLIAEAAALAVKDAHPVNNMAHGSPAYRRKMVGVLTRRGIEQAVAQADKG